MPSTARSAFQAALQCDCTENPDRPGCFSSASCLVGKRLAIGKSLCNHYMTNNCLFKVHPLAELESINLDLNATADSAPRRNCGVQWALPVDAKLEAHVQQALDAGEKTNRREMLSAIVCDFEADNEHLGKILRAYRLMTVAEALGKKPGSDNVIAIQRHGPGPRHIPR